MALMNDVTEGLEDGGDLDREQVVVAALGAAATEKERTVIVAAALESVPDQDKQAVAQAAAEAAVNSAAPDDKAGVARAAAEAAVGAVGQLEERAAVVQGVVQAVPKEERAAVVQTAVEALPQDQLRDVAQAAVAGLTEKDRKELQEAFPQDSDDRKTVFLVGFVVSGVVVIALALIAWGASTVNPGGETTSTAILLLGTAFTSAMLGGLLGAYKGG